ncbi:MAG TPA: hypothetical protein DCW88_10450 [Agrobacterium sp.]|uniref:hypothetical protein n=1 Tax=Agrobacterium pusense TaxID=648995 RepID=UPI000E83C6D2|nr:hypothetical protein [Agrobacterium sp.]
MDRRTVLKGGIVVAACTPALAVAPENPLPEAVELPVDKVHRLAEELAHALDEWNRQTNVKFTAQVAPASSGLGIYFRNERLGFA